MVAENYKIKVPGVMRNHILNVRVLAAFQTRETYDKYMNV